MYAQDVVEVVAAVCAAERVLDKGLGLLDDAGHFPPKMHHTARDH